MRLRQMVMGASLLLCCGIVGAQVAPQGQPPAWIESLAEPGQGLAVQHVSSQTGFATFASSPGKGIAVSLANGSSAEARAKTFVDQYGKAFGLADSSQVRHMKTSAVDEVGIEHERLQQIHKGVPVTGGELMVHLKGARVMAANGRTLGDLPDNVV
jgi:Zn-dependent metalloprotease